LPPAPCGDDLGMPLEIGSTPAGASMRQHPPAHQGRGEGHGPGDHQHHRTRSITTEQQIVRRCRCARARGRRKNPPAPRSRTELERSALGGDAVADVRLRHATTGRTGRSAARHRGRDNGWIHHENSSEERVGPGVVPATSIISLSIRRSHRTFSGVPLDVLSSFTLVQGLPLSCSGIPPVFSASDNGRAREALASGAVGGRWAESGTEVC
jgi:hypothetical protein